MKARVIRFSTTRTVQPTGAFKTDQYASKSNGDSTDIRTNGSGISFDSRIAIADGPKVPAWAAE